VDGAHFRLGEPVSPDVFDGCDALVHCAYDFAPRDWAEISSTNVVGAFKLFEAALAAGVRRIVLISTISAFEGCRSLYGRAKLEIENAGLDHGACIIRPGLVYGPDAGGMFGRLVSQASTGRIVPVPAGGPTFQYLVHHENLGMAVRAALERPVAPRGPVTVAHERPWPLAEIILEIGRAFDRRPILAPVPWRIVFAGLRFAEFLRIPIEMRSDSLVSLIHQNSDPFINVRDELNVECRKFEADFLAR
jgi:nucleoside-diphosphate-sugar epimerase